MSNVELKALRDELIRRKSLQEQAKIEAKKSIESISKLVAELNTISTANSFISVKYPEINNVLNLSIEEGMDQSRLVDLKSCISDLINAMETDLRKVLELNV